MYTEHGNNQDPHGMVSNAKRSRILVIRLVDNLNLVPAVGSKGAIRYWQECNQDVTLTTYCEGRFPATGSR